MNVAEFVDLLDAVPPHRPAAIDLVAELGDMERRGILDHAALALLQPDVDAAISELHNQIHRTSEVVNRCRQLPATPSHKVPPGF